ncbi:Uncharacterised protein [Mycobacteroides abscessus subsp. abscessus]|nr:Uncharacterised protein [Mycobacteroides abscessus subsp. abscessus]
MASDDSMATTKVEKLSRPWSPSKAIRPLAVPISNPTMTSTSATVAAER